MTRDGGSPRLGQGLQQVQEDQTLGRLAQSHLIRQDPPKATLGQGQQPPDTHLSPTKRGRHGFWHQIKGSSEGLPYEPHLFTKENKRVKVLRRIQ